jgi:hypothetical protein
MRGRGFSSNFGVAGGATGAGGTDSITGIRSDTSVILSGVVKSARRDLSTNNNSAKIMTTACAIAEVLQAAGKCACFDSTKSRSVNHSRVLPRSTAPAFSSDGCHGVRFRALIGECRGTAVMP